MRNFTTGATRDVDTNKLDFEGFLSPAVLERYAEYMHKNRVQADGNLRASDNWQKGIPKEAYMKSMWRHFLDVWKAHRGLPTKDSLEDALCALLFNLMGYLFETLRREKEAEHNCNDPSNCSSCLADDYVASHYTHRYGALAHDQESITAEEAVASAKEGNYRSPIKGCINYEQDENAGVPGASSVEYRQVLGICPQRTQGEVDALAAQVRSDGGRKA